MKWLRENSIFNQIIAEKYKLCHIIEKSLSKRCRKIINFEKKITVKTQILTKDHGKNSNFIKGLLNKCKFPQKITKKAKFEKKSMKKLEFPQRCM